MIISLTPCPLQNRSMFLSQSHYGGKRSLLKYEWKIILPSFNTYLTIIIKLGYFILSYTLDHKVGQKV